MSNAEERLLNDQKVDFIHQKAAGKNSAALEYLQFLSQAARIVDDLFDEPASVSNKDLLVLIELLFVRIPSNVFYLQHREQLFTHHLAMWNAWEASNILDKGDSTDKIYAHVLRDYINEVLPLVALLVEGWDKMKEVNGLIRALFKKHLGE